MKHCKTCHELKDDSAFSKDKSQIDQRCKECKSCQKLIYQNNKERFKEAAHRFSEKHPDYYSNWKKEHPDYHKDYYAENKDIINPRSKEYYQNNKLHCKEYYQNNKPHRTAYQNKWKEEHVPHIGFCYIWYDRRDKMYYIGAVWRRDEASYVCSSTWMNIECAKRPADFKRRILSYHNAKDEMHDEEFRLLQMIKPSELAERYYNLRITRQGGGKALVVSPKFGERCSQGWANAKAVA